MKAQLSMDVIIAMIIFVIFVSYLFFQLLALRPTYLQQIKVERVRAEAYQISEMLINDPGEPINWNASYVQRIGLSDQNYNLTNLISWSKVQNLSSLCNVNYELVRGNISTREYQFSIVVVDRDGGASVVCSPPVEVIWMGVMNFTVKRIVGITTLGGIHSGEVVVRVW